VKRDFHLHLGSDQGLYDAIVQFARDPRTLYCTYPGLEVRIRYACAASGYFPDDPVYERRELSRPAQLSVNEQQSCLAVPAMNNVADKRFSPFAAPGRRCRLMHVEDSSIDGDCFRPSHIQVFPGESQSVLRFSSIDLEEVSTVLRFVEMPSSDSTRAYVILENEMNLSRMNTEQLSANASITDVNPVADCILAMVETSHENSARSRSLHQKQIL